LGLSQLFSKSIGDYRSNPILLVPSLVAFTLSLLDSFVVYSVIPLLKAVQTFERSNPNLMDLMPITFMLAGIWIFYSVIDFLVALTRTSLTGKVVSEGSTRGWTTGIKKCFLGVLGVFLVLSWVIQPVLNIADFLFPKVAVGSPAWLVQGMFESFLHVLVFSVYYVWLASAILDAKGALASVRLGSKAISANKKTFAGFVAITFMTSTLVSSMSYVPGLLGIADPQVVGYSTFSGIASALAEHALTPLWLLVAFSLYWHHKPPVISNGSILSQTTS